MAYTILPIANIPLTIINMNNFKHIYHAIIKFRHKTKYLVKIMKKKWFFAYLENSINRIKTKAKFCGDTHCDDPIITNKTHRYTKNKKLILPKKKLLFFF